MDSDQELVSKDLSLCREEDDADSKPLQMARHSAVERDGNTYASQVQIVALAGTIFGTRVFKHTILVCREEDDADSRPFGESSDTPIASDR